VVSLDIKNDSWKNVEISKKSFKGFPWGTYPNLITWGTSRSLGRSLQKVRGTKKSEGDPDLKK
jgi:hypothetical protein